jgi:hypothetical protein
MKPAGGCAHAMPIVRDYSGASQFFACDFLGHEERCILSKAAF